MTTIVFGNLSNNGSGAVPFVRSFASQSALGNVGAGRVPNITGYALQTAFVPNNLPPGNGAGITPKVRGVALITATPLAIGIVPSVTGKAAQGVAGMEIVPKVRSIAGQLIGNFGIGVAPIVYAYAATMAQPKPSISAAYGASPFVKPSATAGITYVANQSTGKNPVVRGVASTFAAPIGIVTAPRVYGQAYSTVPPMNSASLLMSPGYLAVSALNSPLINQIFSSFSMSSGFSTVRAVLMLLDALKLGDLATPAFKVSQTLNDLLTLSASAPIEALKYLLANNVNVASIPSGWLVVQQILSNVLSFASTATPKFNSKVSIAMTLALHDTLSGSTLAKRADTFNATSNLTATAIAIASLIDHWTAASSVSGRAVLFGFLANNINFADTANIIVRIKQALADGLIFGITLYTGQDAYTAWVMTPETRAMRSYANYPFNSYAHLGGKLYGAASDGIYLLSGDTDNGSKIYASVRTGLLDFGTRQLKRMDRAYLGYTSQGTLCLRVCTTSPDGQKADYTYKMVPVTAGAPRENRIRIGRGTQSVYWEFELDNNVDASRFELHDVVMLPMTLTRRVRQ